MRSGKRKALSEVLSDCILDAINRGEAGQTDIVTLRERWRVTWERVEVYSADLDPVRAALATGKVMVQWDEEGVFRLPTLAAVASADAEPLGDGGPDPEVVGPSVSWWNFFGAHYGPGRAKKNR